MKTRIRNRGYESPFPICVPAGDSAVLVYLGDKLDLNINNQVHALARILMQDPLDGFVESVPGYSSLMVVYDPLKITYIKVQSWVLQNLEVMDDTPPLQLAHISIPVVYGGEFGPDLEFVASYNHLTTQEVIAVHASATYPVHFIGFLPGFPYLGGMDSSIATPRLETPRALIRAGSVGIAGGQTGIYPLDSPAGWRIIGWTPVKLFDASRAQPALLKPGDLVKLNPVSAKEANDAVHDH